MEVICGLRSAGCTRPILSTGVGKSVIVHKDKSLDLGEQDLRFLDR